MTTDTSTYRRSLMVALRHRHVPADRIGEIVAGGREPCRGQDPVEAFGAPVEDAAGLVPAPRGSWVVAWALTRARWVAC
jgi:hypothetical protein